MTRPREPAARAPGPAAGDRVGLRIDPRRAGAPRGGLPGDGGAPPAEAVLVERAARAEALGFDVVWVAERPTRDEALVPLALPVCAAIAARTARLRVATGLLPLPLHHPIRVAEDAATLDLVSGGRFELGVGLGSDPEGLARWGVPAPGRAERFEEALDLVTAAWGPEPVSGAGPTWTIPATPVVPKPSRPGPALWVGVARPEAQARAARRGAGLVLPVPPAGAAGTSPDPYLDAFAVAWPGSVPRVAWLIDAPSEAPALRERARGARIDWVLPCPEGPGADARLEALAAEVVPALRA